MGNLGSTCCFLVAWIVIGGIAQAQSPAGGEGRASYQAGQLPYARITGPVDLKNCGYFKFSGPEQRFGRTPSPCTGLAGGITVDLQHYCTFLTDGQYHRRKEDESGWQEREQAWRGDAPICLHGSSTTSRVIEAKMPLFTVCMHHWFRALGYSQSGAAGGTGVYPVVAKRHSDLPMALFRYVDRSLSCYYLSRDQFNGLRNRTKIRFAVASGSAFKPVDMLPYYVPIYVEVEVANEQDVNTRSVEVKAPDGVLRVRVDKVGGKLYRSAKPFVLAPRDASEGVQP